MILSSIAIAGPSEFAVRNGFALQFSEYRIIRVQQLGRVDDEGLAQRLGVQPYQNPWAPYWWLLLYEQKDQ